ncbi:SDR family NAD(P)-dependent oxidoreductase [Mesorhizobium camelthorni]|uniref:SDR family NAD(P)-dependent oxidoreductase n=1 Tax=Allomesorhizobium camelthorni TaxID=475069 RepID=A0A6G4WN78_9HYPH|nr:SDR family NAD(P)-dependent oxidoreductase [Mesorhizobium camelthorni]
MSLHGDTVEACTPETLARTFAVNLDGMFLGCKHVITPMRRQGNGSIINIGSILGRVTDGASAAYTASKGGVGMLTKSTALHLAQDGARCALQPGLTDLHTHTHDGALAGRASSRKSPSA